MDCYSMSTVFTPEDTELHKNTLLKVGAVLFSQISMWKMFSFLKI